MTMTAKAAAIRCICTSAEKMVPYRGRLALRIARLVLALTSSAWYFAHGGWHLTWPAAVMVAYALYAAGALLEVKYDTPSGKVREVHYAKFARTGKGMFPRIMVLQPDATKRVLELRLSDPRPNMNLSERDFRK